MSQDAASQGFKSRDTAVAVMSQTQDIHRILFLMLLGRGILQLSREHLYVNAVQIDAHNNSSTSTSTSTAKRYMCLSNA